MRMPNNNDNNKIDANESHVGECNHCIDIDFRAIHSFELFIFKGKTNCIPRGRW